MVLALAALAFALGRGSAANDPSPDTLPTPEPEVLLEDSSRPPADDSDREYDELGETPETTEATPPLEVPGSGAAPVPAGATTLCVFGTTRFVEFYLFEDPSDPLGDDLLYVGGNAEQGYIELPAEAVYFPGGGVSGHRMVSSDGTQYYLTGHELTVTPPSGEALTQIVRSWESYGC